MKKVWRNSDETLTKVWRKSKESLKKVWRKCEESVKKVWKNSDKTLTKLWRNPEETLKKVWRKSEESLKKVWRNSEECLKKVWRNSEHTLKICPIFDQISKTWIIHWLTDSSTWIQEMLAHLKRMGRITCTSIQWYQCGLQLTGQAIEKTIKISTNPAPALEKQQGKCQHSFHAGLLNA